MFVVAEQRSRPATNDALAHAGAFPEEGSRASSHEMAMAGHFAFGEYDISIGSRGIPSSRIGNWHE